MTPTPVADLRSTAQIQRRILTTLMVSQTFGSAANITVAAILALLAAEMTGQDRLAGIPAAVLTLGTALIAGPLARRASRKGRRPALWTGYLFGVAGAGLGVLAGQMGAFLLLLAAMFIFGGGQAAGLQTRFAAADLAEPEHRAKAISLVVWVSALGGALAPGLAESQNRWGAEFGLRLWVTPVLVAGVLFGIAGWVVAGWLRPERLRVGKERQAKAAAVHHRFGATVREVAGHPRAILAVATLGITQAAMVGVMVMTPLHMRDHGQAGLAGWVIGFHAVGMFGLAPLVGRAIDRWGPLNGIRAGSVILVSGVLTAVIAGYQPVLIFAGLFLLGLGWSFGLISASSLLIGAVAEEFRVTAQGFSDALLSVLAGLAALTSGLIKQSIGYHWLASFSAVAVAGLVLAAGLVSKRPVERPAVL
ncbi:MAG: MFS transporter [Actinomycetota bacterium]